MYFRRRFFVLNAKPNIIEKIADFDNLPKWDKSVIEVNSGREAFKVGKEYFVRLTFEGKSLEMKYIVQDYEHNSKVELVGVGDYVWALDTIQIVKKKGGCEITYEAIFKLKFPFWLLDPILQIRFSSNVDEAMKGLQSFSEKIASSQNAT